jgi:hypothetical protein
MKPFTKLYYAIILIAASILLFCIEFGELAAIGLLLGIGGIVLLGDFINYKQKSITKV